MFSYRSSGPRPTITWPFGQQSEAEGPRNPQPTRRAFLRAASSQNNEDVLMSLSDNKRAKQLTWWPFGICFFALGGRRGSDRPIS